MSPASLPMYLSHPVKGYVRKGNALLALKDTVRAMQAFEKALEIDPNNAVSRLLQHVCRTCFCDLVPL